MLSPALTLALLPAAALLSGGGGRRVRKLIPCLFIYLISFLFFTLLFWPYLWIDPVGNFIGSITKMANYPYGPGKQLFMGREMLTHDPPWYYLPVWISISTPLPLLGLMGSGLLFLILKLKAALKERDPASGPWAALLAWVIVPPAAAIILGSTLYSDFKHVYFIYPALALACGCGAKALVEHVSGAKRHLIWALIGLALIHSVSVHALSHPVQETYVNRLAGPTYSEAAGLFGLQKRTSRTFYLPPVRHILKNDGREKVYVALTRDYGKRISYMLTEEERDRISFVHQKHADYVILTYDVDVTLKRGGTEIYSLGMGDMKIASVYDVRP